MRAIDANVLVRLLVRDESRQLARAEEFIAPGTWVSHLVLAETFWVLESVYERTPRQIAGAIDALLAHTSLTLQEPDVVAAALRHCRRKAAPGFSDCLILEIARKAGQLPLGTFDRALGALPGVQRLS